MHWRLMTIVALGVGLVVGAGCSRSLGMETVRSSIKDGLEKQLGVQVASVECPAERPIKADDTFECTAATTGTGRFTISVRQTDTAGNIKWEVSRSEGLLDLQLLEKSIATGLKEQASVEAKVDCGGRFGDARPGRTFTCHAVSPSGESTTVTVTVKDAEGNIDWKVGGEG